MRLVGALTIIGASFTVGLLIATTATAPAAPTLSMDAFRDRLRGGWAGQMIGVSYGSAYEFQSNGKPITGDLREWKPGYVEESLRQDDLYVEMTFLKTLEVHGPRTTSEHAAADFRESQYDLWHANATARDHLRRGIAPPFSGSPHYNAHAEDIDLQIESDLFGLVSPGMFRAAAELSDVFGRMIGSGDGLYGGRFVSAMISQAYLEAGPSPAAVRRCVEAGLAAIPEGSSYAGLIRDVIAEHQDHPDDWLRTWQNIQSQWGDTDRCPDGKGRPFNIDAKLNGGYVVLGLLHGGADFARTLEITTRAGQDADCNASTAAGVLGVLHGYSRIPPRFTSGIPALAGRRFSHTEYDVETMLEASERVALQILAHEGGRRIERDGVDVLELPWQRPVPPSMLSQALELSEEQGRRFVGAWDDLVLFFRVP
jgi:ADP-ribosylglycohydrolase